MRILGIETSCDETSAAVVEDGRRVLSSVVSSQIALHAPYGGVVPEIASRQHVRQITQITGQALREAQVELRELDAVAVTYGPGLAGALLVGLSFARGLSLGLGFPLIPVNHLEGHLHSVWLADDPSAEPAPPLPLLALIVSGGHTELILMRDHGRYQLIGRTRDDAAGEAFDKVARLIGLPYPGGPAIQRAAEAARDPVELPRAWLPGSDDFSFSGLKTAVLHTAYELAAGRSPHEIRGERLPQVEIGTQLSPEQVANIAAGFQESVGDVLVTKALAAAHRLEVKGVALVGGVAANAPLRRRLLEESDLPVFISQSRYATDNAAMIAGAAYYAPRSDSGVDVVPDLALA